MCKCLILSSIRHNIQFIFNTLIDEFQMFHFGYAIILKNIIDSAYIVIISVAPPMNDFLDNIFTHKPKVATVYSRAPSIDLALLKLTIKLLNRTVLNTWFDRP